MFVIDDVGWTDVGYRNESGMLTPHLDDLMRTGVTLDDYYVQPVCSPSRAALMQGRYPFHTGMQHYETIMPASEAAMPFSQPTLAEMLQESGYDRHAIGKWHLGYARWANTPTGRGFESHTGYFQGMEDYYHKNFSVPQEYLPGIDITGYDWWHNKTVGWGDNGTYNADLYEQQLDRVAEAYASAHPTAADRSAEPLFLYYAHQIVHVPLQAPEEYIARCTHISDPLRKIYCGMMARLDDATAHLVDTLKRLDLWDNSFVVVTTDNGGIPNYGSFPASAGCNWPLRAGKGTVFQGGVKAVGFVNGGVIPDAARGTSTKSLTHIVDWFPTIMNLANGNSTAPPAADANGNAKQLDSLQLDGFDLWDALTSGAAVPRTSLPLNINHNVSFPDSGVQVGILSNNWKLIYQQVKGNTLVYDGWYPPPPAKPIPAPSNPSGQYLFNLEEDPNEHVNLFDSRPDKVKELQMVLDQYLEGYVPPQPNKFHLLAVPELHNGTWAPWL